MSGRAFHHDELGLTHTVLVLHAIQNRQSLTIRSSSPCSPWPTPETLPSLPSPTSVSSYLSAFHKTDRQFDASNSGWPGAWAWFVGLLQGAYTLTGYGMVAALCEEVKNPEREVPRAMVLSVAAAFLTGVVYLVSVIDPFFQRDTRADCSCPSTLSFPTSSLCSASPLSSPCPCFTRWSRAPLERLWVSSSSVSTHAAIPLEPPILTTQSSVSGRLRLSAPSLPLPDVPGRSPETEVSPRAATGSASTRGTVSPSGRSGCPPLSAPCWA